jgi:alkylation response protein AidB-like acyl-CoA dehydrogenase
LIPILVLWIAPTVKTVIMNFELPSEVQDYLSRLDAFINEIILPLQRKDDNEHFFDHHREPSRTQWHNQGLPTENWENLLRRARALADQAGFYRFACPKEYGGSGTDSLNLYMCAIRYHLASHPVYGGGVSLANDLQTEHSVGGNNPFIIMLCHYGSVE